MANIHFLPSIQAKSNKKGQQPIIMRDDPSVSPHLSFFVGFVVHPKHWSQPNEKGAKEQREDEPDNNYIAINERIQPYKRKSRKSHK
jgi:hypothetical protein